MIFSPNDASPKKKKLNCADKKHRFAEKGLTSSLDYSYLHTLLGGVDDDAAREAVTEVSVKITIIDGSGRLIIQIG